MIDYESAEGWIGEQMRTVWAIKSINKIWTDKTGNTFAEIVVFDNSIKTAGVNTLFNRINEKWFLGHLHSFKYIECYETNIYKDEFILDYKTIIEEKLL